MPRRSTPPSYRLHKPSGRAVVTLDGRDHYLGKHGSPESRAEYDRLVAEWLVRGRTPLSTAADTGPTIAELILAYWQHAETHYRAPDGSPGHELDNVRDALRPLRKLYGKTPAGQFGPLALRTVRDAMVASRLARTTVNARINRIRRAFRWAASMEMIRSEQYEALRTVDGLRKGRTAAREPEPIGPVPPEDVERTLRHMPATVAAMVRLQLLTGMRAGEVLAMRECDLSTTGPEWEYRPPNHKNAWRGRARVIPLGPAAVEVVRGFLSGNAAAHVFRPQAPSPAARKGQRRGRRTGREAVTGYDRRSYRQAVVRACRRAGVPPWSPLRLRHTAATLIRARFGLEAAQAVLGHSKPDTTVIYAERDLERARSVMREIG